MKTSFNIHEFLKTRPLSWSAVSSFEYSPEQWYETYILGKRQESKEMTFGSLIDKRIQDDPNFLPHLPRYEHMQYKMKVMFDGIPLVGVPDGLNLTGKKELADYKTGKKKWDKKRADETGQLTFYLFLLYITHKIKPEEFILMIHWLPTEETGSFEIRMINEQVKTFYTKRTMSDLLAFGARIKKVVKEMEIYANQKMSNM